VPSLQFRTATSWTTFFRGRVATYRDVVARCGAWESEYSQLTDRELRKQSLSLRYRAKSGERLAGLLPEAFALVREASCRATGLRHYDVQMLGGAALFFGAIAEMETGEGKTLTASLPLYLHALGGRGVHLATVNDYLAERDGELLRPLYELLGLSVGVVLTPHSSDQRRAAYACDITYGTAKEFGFDFLRDRLLMRRMGLNETDFLGGGSSQRWDTSGEKPVQRGFHFCLVDEADSILIDEARTPLIIGSIEGKAREQIVATYNWAARNAKQFIEDEHYTFDHDKKKVELTATGRQFVRVLPRPDLVRSMGLVDLYEYTERAVKVDREYQLDREYVVDDGEIVIVDEYTGRKAEGRKWRDGIHQAVEAKEGVEVTVPTGQAARITVQDLFLRYRQIAGMTGTARSSAREFRKIYKMPFVRVPTNRPVCRRRLADRAFGTSDAKWQAIVAEIRELHLAGRPVLIGTRSIDKSQILAGYLTQEGVPHQVLNAHEIAKEAEIVALAGQTGKVTVATNMAGRGTDIKLGPGVAELGGLHVICTEVHDAARIDRQLIGRCGRQGDPGTARQFMSLDDEILLSGFGPKASRRWKRRGAAIDAAPCDRFTGLFRRAQRKVERRHFRDRSVLLHHEKQRKKLQRELGQDPYLDTPD